MGYDEALRGGFPRLRITRGFPFTRRVGVLQIVLAMRDNLYVLRGEQSSCLLDRCHREFREAWRVVLHVPEPWGALN